MSIRIGLVSELNIGHTTLYRYIKDAFRDKVHIDYICFEDKVTYPLENDIIVVSSKNTEKKALQSNLIKKSAQIVYCKRNIDTENLEQIKALVKLPSNTRVAVFHINYELSMKVVEMLKNLGIVHVHYIPYYLGQNPPEADIIVTCGSPVSKVGSAKNVIDIGARSLAVETLIDLSKIIDIEYKVPKYYTNENIKLLVEQVIHSAEDKKAIKETKGRLETLLNISDNGMAILSDTYQIVSANNSFCKMMGLDINEIIGIIITDLIEGFVYLDDENVNDLYNIITIQGRDYQLIIKDIPSEVDDHEHIVEFINVPKKYNSAKKSNFSLDDIITVNEKMLLLKNFSEKIAKTDYCIIINGESGTGKELFAQSIHDKSDRRDAPFIATNITTFSSGLIESELFGYDEGSFTGARKGGKPGIFEQASGGTLFLDEIGDLSLDLQPKLLRVLQEKTIQRVGGTKEIKLDVRIIAATNKNLKTLVDEQLFRGDLYYRLNVIPINLPPLRERKDDIKYLLEYFLNINEVPISIITPSIHKILYGYDWYGNVRELKNLVTFVSFYYQISDIDQLEEKIINYIYRNSSDSSDLIYINNEVDSIDGILSKLERKGYIQDYLIVLREYKIAYDKHLKVCRNDIFDSVSLINNKLSINKIRNIMKILDENNLIAIGMTRQGTRITQLGLKFFESYQDKV